MVFESLHPTIAVTVISAILLVVINAFYRFMINQDRAGQLKAQARELSKQAKASDPEKSKELMKETMGVQRQIMKMNMKPMILSLIVVAVLLPFLAVTFNDVEFARDTGEFTANGKMYTFSVQGENSLTIAGQDCSLPCKVILGNVRWNVQAAEEKVKVSLIAAQIPPGVPGIGGWELGWIWWYILSSIPLAIIIRVAYGIRS